MYYGSMNFGSNGDLDGDNGRSDPLLAEDLPPPRGRRRQKSARRGGRGDLNAPVFSHLFHSSSQFSSSSSRLPAIARKKSPRSTIPDPMQSQDILESTEPPTASQKSHSFLYTMLNPRSHQWQAVWFQKIIATIIVIDLIFFILSTDPRYKDLPIFYPEEGAVSSIFLLEYMCRLWTVTESRKYGAYGPCMGRFFYLISWPAIIDAMAAFPFFLELPTQLSLARFTFLRCFRLSRILKTNGVFKAMESVWRVVYFNREILLVALNLCAFLVLSTSVALYYMRPEDSAEFESLPATMYMSVMMLTGQGGPEGTELPWYTRFVVLMTSVFSVAMFAIPASMLTWGFEAEAARCAKVARKKHKSPDYQSSSSESEFSSGASTTDEEYLKIIAGEEDDDDEEEDPLLREFSRVFAVGDEDGTGSLSKQEFFKIMLAQMAEQKAKAVSGKAREQLTNLETRVVQLETSVAETHQKLDQVIQLLQGRQM